jgi:hypothetical protein
MRELLIQQKAFAAFLFCFKPVSEPLQGDSMQNMVSRSFLLSLWWKELTCLAVLVCVLLFVATRLALSNRAPQTQRIVKSQIIDKKGDVQLHSEETPIDHSSHARKDPVGKV